MIVYTPQDASSRRIYVSPSDGAQYLSARGRGNTFIVQFRGGRAKVSDGLGRFMIETGMARLSPVLKPDDIALPMSHAV